MIKTLDLHKSYRGIEVLKGLCFEIASGEVALLAGRNGAGKTTWLRLALGLAVSQKGSVLFDGSSCALVRKMVAVVFDEPPVYPGLSGQENLTIMTSGADFESSWARHVKKVLNLEPGFLNMKARGYSLGQRRRLAIGAALLRKPKYLFLDEPTVGLDPVAWEMVRNSLESLMAEKQSTIVLTGQDFDAIEKIVDKVIVLKDGQSVFDGTLGQLTSRRLPRVTVSTTDYGPVLARFPMAKLIDHRGRPRVEIPCSTMSETETIVKEIQGLSLNLQSLDVRSDTLEEAFLAIEGASEFSEASHAAF